MAQLEGRPPLAGRDIADLLDVTEAKAWRITYRLRRRGIARTIAALKPRSGDLESITYLRGVWSDPAWPATIEGVLRADPTVADAACVTGRFDYRVRAFHPDAYAANAWFRDLLTAPGVAEGRMQFSRTILERPNYAAALLAGTSAASEGPP